jgi:TonB family protein
VAGVHDPGKAVALVALPPEHGLQIPARAAALSLTASVSMSAADQSPTPVSQPAPNYAFDLRHDEIEGKVTVSYTVNAKGEVVDGVVVSSTEKAFERPTLAAIRQWKFTPATKDGVAVSTSVRQTINFTLPYLHAENAAAIARVVVKANSSPSGAVASNK